MSAMTLRLFGRFLADKWPGHYQAIEAPRKLKACSTFDRTPI